MSIQSVLAEDVPPDHHRTCLELAFRGIGVAPELAAEVCRMPLQDIPLPIDFSKLARRP